MQLRFTQVVECGFSECRPCTYVVRYGDGIYYKWYCGFLKKFASNISLLVYRNMKVLVLLFVGLKSCSVHELTCYYYEYIL